MNTMFRECVFLFVTVEVKNTVMNNNLRLCTIHKWRFCIMFLLMIARR
jgi:hypothetical protein